MYGLKVAWWNAEQPPDRFEVDGKTYRVLRSEIHYTLSDPPQIILPIAIGCREEK